MKTPRPSVTTADIERAFRNSTSPAARLAAWQAVPSPRRLAQYKAKPGTGPLERLAVWRDEQMRYTIGPEMSAPCNETPLLWLSLSSREILDSWAGREFLDHRGWFTDERETVEAYAVRLVRFPHLMFEATRDSMNGDLRVMLNEWHETNHTVTDSDYDWQNVLEYTAEQAIRSADSTAERMAEDEREYQRVEDLKYRIEENREELKTLRSEIRDLAGELKRLCPTGLPEAWPHAAKAVRGQLSALLAKRTGLMEKNARLAAEI